MYLTSDDMAEHLFSPIRRIRIELGDPTLGRLSDDSWLNNELQRVTAKSRRCGRLARRAGHAAATCWR